ncbi:MAG: RNase adapter RapZ [Actinomycetota bacterium]
MSAAAPLVSPVLTGLSGAGRSTAADALEDLGFYVIDNLPPALIGKVADLARSGERSSRYVLVVDVRSGLFVDDLTASLAELRASGAITRVVFLDAADEVLVRRYEATRRRHPLADGDRMVDGIARERRLLEDLKGRADVVLDTTDLNVHELRERVRSLLDERGTDDEFHLSVVSFGYKHGVPVDVDLVFDVRFLPNPHWVDELRPLTGTDEPVREFVLGQPDTEQYLAELERLFRLTLPAYRREGKSYLSIAIGCTGGRHRSVAVAEALAGLLGSLGYEPTVRHRDRDRD